LKALAHRTPSSTSAPLEALDAYQLVARLGRGGMAEIMLASRPGAHGPELVVVKRLHDEDAEDPAILGMFLDESRLSLRLRHPNIVRADALGIVEGRHALVMEFLEGQPLQQVMKRLAALGRLLPLELVVPAFADVLDGLHYAHELCGTDGRPLNVIHRDVSPHNLFVTTFGNLKLLDFGIAKTRIQENRTRTGLLKGKVAYMAPEQAQGARLDRRADVWSAGVTLWEAISGARLFKADNEAASLRLTLGGPITSLTQVRKDVPPELDAIVMRALQRDPALRFPTALSMAQALRSFGDKRGMPLTTPLKDLMGDLFGREVAEQRVRIHALVTASEGVPSSSSMPALSTSIPASGRRRVIVANASGAASEAPGGPAVETLSAGSEGAVVTHVSSVSDFVGQLHRDQRTAFRWMSLVIAALSLAVVGLGVAFTTRVGQPPPEAASLPQKLATPELAEARRAPAPARLEPGTAVRDASGVLPPAAQEPPAAERLAPAPQSPVAPRRRLQRESTSLTAPPESPTPSPPESPAAKAPAPARTATESGFLTLDSTPWSEVSADGVALGQTPLVRVKLPAGPHVLTLRNRERGLSTTYQVTIEAGKTSVRRVGLD